MRSEFRKKSLKNLESKKDRSELFLELEWKFNYNETVEDMIKEIRKNRERKSKRFNDVSFFL